MRKAYKSILKMNNSVDAATSSRCWGKKAKHYPGVAGKSGHTTNFEIKDGDREKEV